MLYRLSYRTAASATSLAPCPPSLALLLFLASSLAALAAVACRAPRSPCARIVAARPSRSYARVPACLCLCASRTHRARRLRSQARACVRAVRSRTHRAPRGRRDASCTRVRARCCRRVAARPRACVGVRFSVPVSDVCLRAVTCARAAAVAVAARACTHTRIYTCTRARRTRPLASIAGGRRDAPHGAGRWRATTESQHRVR
jgi:hypothetical protein